MTAHRALFWLSLARFLSGALAACSCAGTDYTHGGTYYIDQDSEQYFKFSSVFSGCTEGIVEPVLVSPNNDHYICSSLDSGYNGDVQVSTCEVPFLAMETGEWTVVLQAESFDFTVMREFELIPARPVTTTVTRLPTVVVAVIDTPAPLTTQSTVYQYITQKHQPPPVTQQCGWQTQTVTQYVPGPTATVTSTIPRFSYAPHTTQYYYTTSVVAASCQWPQGRPPAVVVDIPAPAPTVPAPSDCGGTCRPWLGDSGWTWREWSNGRWGNIRGGDTGSSTGAGFGGAPGGGAWGGFGGGSPGGGTAPGTGGGFGGGEIGGGGSGGGFGGGGNFGGGTGGGNSGGGTPPGPVRGGGGGFGGGPVRGGGGGGVVAPPGRGGGRGGGRGRGSVDETVDKRAIAGRIAAAMPLETAHVAAREAAPVATEAPRGIAARQIVSVSQLGAPVTQTQLVRGAMQTVTEFVYDKKTVYETVPPQTICGNPGVLTLTSLSMGAPQTEIAVQYTTYWTTPTAAYWQTTFVTSNDWAQATQCWAAGGSYGV